MRATSEPPPRRSDRARCSEHSSQDRAERRQVTVMFSDLVGSTALSARMDPEDLREIISTYQKCVAETVERFGGLRGEVHGRWGAGVLRVSPSARGRRRACGTRRTGANAPLGLRREPVLPAFARSRTGRRSCNGRGARDQSAKSSGSSSLPRHRSRCRASRMILAAWSGSSSRAC